MSGRDGGRQCPFCGKPIAKALSRCPHCREVVPQVQVSAPVRTTTKGGQIRRGLLYMLLALVIHFAVQRADVLHLPLTLPPAIPLYLTPIMFLGGLGLTLYGFVSRVVN